MRPAARLRREIAQTIQLRGPISVAAWMRMAATHPEGGYYAAGAGLRRAGAQVDADASDFVTAPEMTPVFGEALGVRIAHELQTRLAHGARPFRLVELGPGSGALAATIVGVADVRERLRGVVLVERSAGLARSQAASLLPLGVRSDWTPSVDGVSSLCALGDEALVFVSNEFFDALPVHAYVAASAGGGLHELFVDALDAGDDAHFRLVRGPAESRSAAAFRVRERVLLRVPPSAPWPRIVEYAPEAERTASAAAALLRRTGGMFLAVDYGHVSPPGTQTLRAVRRHALLPSPLDLAGEADVSADVDFGLLASCFPRGAFHVDGPVTQRAYLLASGVRERTAALRAAALCREGCDGGGGVRTEAAAKDNQPADRRMRESDRISAATERIVDPEGMGSAYKVFSAVARI